LLTRARAPGSFRISSEIGNNKLSLNNNNKIIERKAGFFLLYYFVVVVISGRRLRFRVWQSLTPIQFSFFPFSFFFDYTTIGAFLSSSSSSGSLLIEKR
jgi:hypothetical protein